MKEQVAQLKTDFRIGKIAMIWAQDRGGLLGASGTMVWHVPADFQHFKATTLGHCLIMGSTSYQALGSRPLKGRKNIVLSSRKKIEGMDFAEVSVASNFFQALQLASGQEEVWIAGGAKVYEQAIEFADELVVSELDFFAPLPAGLQPVYAPKISEKYWQIDYQKSDSTWREVSGDGAWKVTVYVPAKP